MLIKLIHCPGAGIPESAPERAYARTGMRFLTVVVTNLEEAIEACRSAGARIVQERRCYEGAVHYAFVADPDGNEIELYIDVPGVDWKSNPALIAAPIKPLVL